MKKTQAELIEGINKKKFTVYGYVKMKDRILLVKDSGDFKPSKWKTPGGGAGLEEVKFFGGFTKIDFIKTVLQRRIFVKTKIILDAKEVVFIKQIDGHSFVFMTTKLDHSSRRKPKIIEGSGIKEARLFSIEEVKEMLKRGEILENHTLALKEVLNLK